MPFVWNGIDYKTVDDDEFEKNSKMYRGYVVVRRLFVSELATDQTEDYLRKHFQIYGEIDSIKLLENGNKGYVTFTSDKAARLAFMMKEEIRLKGLSEMRTEIAYAWHQPEPKFKKARAYNDAKRMKLDEQSDTRIEINETLNILNYKMTLNDLHKLVHLWSHHFLELNFCVRDYKQLDKTICCYLEQIGKHCTNIQHMYFEVKTFRNDFISVLKPIFKNLNTLEIFVDQSEVDPKIDFTKLLPKLVRFNLVDHSFFTGNIFNNCLKKSWPSLKGFCYNHQERQDHPRTDIFFTLNPQIRWLELRNGATRHLQEAANLLPNIKQLTLFNFGRHFQQSIHLGRFPNLTELQVDKIPRAKLSELGIRLHNLNNLKKFRIYCSFDGPNELEIPTKEQQQAIVGFARTRRNIEEFFLNGFQLKEATVVDFVRFAANLKLLRLRNCGIAATSSLITKIVDVRKCNQENQNKLELWVNENERNDCDAINEKEVRRFLSVRFFEK